MPTSGPIALRRLVESVRPADTDAELLAQFGADRDEAAFAALVRRHGALVAEVCRSVLRNEADADDAFQATFLVLARNAGSVRKGGSLAAWLYGVALRVSRRSRAASARRRVCEAAQPSPPAVESDEAARQDIRRVVHEELAALPEAYRVPLVLCHLTGMTQDRAAGELGITTPALKKRLERGRIRLRSVLIGRGLGPPALLVAFTPVTSACPARLLPLAVATATGPGTIPVHVQALANGALTMTLTKCSAALVLVTAAVLTTTVGAGEPPGRGESPSYSKSGATEQERPATDADAAWLAGEWRVKSITTDGVERSGETVKKAVVAFHDGRFEPIGRGLDGLALGTFTLTPSRSPKGFDLRFQEGPRKGETVAGIYTFNTNEVRIALRVEREELGRPAGYHSSQGSGILTLILEPVGTKGPPPSAPKATSDIRDIPLPKTTPFGAYTKERAGYLAAYRNGYAWAKGDRTVAPPEPTGTNLHAVRGWVEGWRAGAMAGGTGDLPAKYAKYLVWGE